MAPTGVLSSWLTLAMKSRRTAARRDSSVRSVISRTTRSWSSGIPWTRRCRLLLRSGGRRRVTSFITEVRLMRVLEAQSRSDLKPICPRRTSRRSSAPGDVYSTAPPFVTTSTSPGSSRIRSMRGSPPGPMSLPTVEGPTVEAPTVEESRDAGGSASATDERGDVMRAIRAEPGPTGPRGGAQSPKDRWIRAEEQERTSTSQGECTRQREWGCADSRRRPGR